MPVRSSYRAGQVHACVSGVRTRGQPRDIVPADTVYPGRPGLTSGRNTIRIKALPMKMRSSGSAAGQDFCATGLCRSPLQRFRPNSYNYQAIVLRNLLRDRRRGQQGREEPGLGQYRICRVMRFAPTWEIRAPACAWTWQMPQCLSQLTPSETPVSSCIEVSCSPSTRALASTARWRPWLFLSAPSARWRVLVAPCSTTTRHGIEHVWGIGHVRCGQPTSRGVRSVMTGSETIGFGVAVAGSARRSCRMEPRAAASYSMTIRACAWSGRPAISSPFASGRNRLH